MCVSTLSLPMSTDLAWLMHHEFPGDGLRHFGYQKEQKFYNGVTLDDIHGQNKTNVNGIHGKLILTLWMSSIIVSSLFSNKPYPFVEFHAV